MFRHALAAVLTGLAALTAPALAAADTVTQWNQNAANSLYVTAAQPPNVSVLHMAMVQGAVYDAVNAIDGGREGYLLTSRVATPTDSKDAAAATAAYKVLISIVPAQQPALLALYNSTLAGIADGAAKTRGIAVGDAAAAAMIAARTADGRLRIDDTDPRANVRGGRCGGGDPPRPRVARRGVGRRAGASEREAGALPRRREDARRTVRRRDARTRGRTADVPPRERRRRRRLRRSRTSSAGRRPPARTRSCTAAVARRSARRRRRTSTTG